MIEHQSGDVVNIEVAEPHWSLLGSSYSINIRVRVPHRLLLEVHTSDGSVTLRSVGGSLRIETGDGGIQADDLVGDIDAHSGDGDMHLSGVFGALHIRTGDGSADIHAFSATRLSSEWRIQAGDGDVRLTIPRNLPADLRLHTDDGSLHVDLLVNRQGETDENELRGQLNGGGPLIDVRTGDGSIRVSGS